MTGKLTSAIIFVLFVCIISCSKKSGNNSGSNPPGPPAPTDSLGSGWQKIIVDTTVQFTDIFFPDNKTGYVCSASGKVFKSTDGGLTWKNLTVPAGTNNLFNIFF